MNKARTLTLLYYSTLLRACDRESSTHSPCLRRSTHQDDARWRTVTIAHLERKADELITTFGNLAQV